MCGVGTCRRPELVARYYTLIRRNCLGCKVVAADLLDQPNMVGWARAFRRAARFEPKYWGLHDYIDANRFQTIAHRIAAEGGARRGLADGDRRTRRAPQPLEDQAAPGQGARGPRDALHLRSPRAPGSPRRADLHLPLELIDVARQLGLGARSAPTAGARPGARRRQPRAWTGRLDAAAMRPLSLICAWNWSQPPV